MMRPNGSTSAPIQNATRQPRPSSSAGASIIAIAAPTAPPTREAADWLADCHEPISPRRFGGAASIRKAVAGPTSPPSAKPWIRRKVTTAIGAITPIWANDGVDASPRIATPMRANESSMAGRRPMRSPMAPMAKAPIGRVRKPAPNVPSEAIRLANGECDGKKALPMSTAKMV